MNDTVFVLLELPGLARFVCRCSQCGASSPRVPSKSEAYRWAAEHARACAQQLVLR